MGKAIPSTLSLTVNSMPLNAAMTPGAYRLAIVIKNMATGEVGTLHTSEVCRH